LRDLTSFTDCFVICTAANSRQTQAISDEVSAELKRAGHLPLNVEGYKNAEWVLVDFGDFIVHVFQEKTRLFYDLERLWHQAKTIET
jgi:ribosome-associated protein